jgi:hypothetical protein
VTASASHASTARGGQDRDSGYNHERVENAAKIVVEIVKKTAD